jgi:hypothetical protein
MTRPSSRDAQKIAGDVFSRMVKMISTGEDNEALAKSCISDRQNLGRLIDDLIGELEQSKELLEAEQLANFQKMIAETEKSGSEWLKRKSSGNFESFSKGGQRIGLFQSLFASSLFTRRKKTR